MSIISTAINLVVMHEGSNIVYDSHNTSVQCENIRDMKREIERVHAFSIGSQLISYENILLTETIRL